MSLSSNSELWLRTGERTRASETIFTYATGIDAMSDWGEGLPETLVDLRSCRLLFDQCPELRSCLPRVAHLSREWAEVVNFWDDLCALHDLEDPDWRDHASAAPQTKKMLDSLIGATER